MRTSALFLVCLGFAEAALTIQPWAGGHNRDSSSNLGLCPRGFDGRGGPDAWGYTWLDSDTSCPDAP
ncbi:hypothetical protein FJY69_08765, partial [candidate division WOR-3 bacterium]|nr:hypothetical protein [candidate division WOR-3 bacterium]